MITITRHKRHGDTEPATITEALEDIANKICDEYCKYPDTWDEEKEGCELCDSEICKNCPVGRLV